MQPTLRTERLTLVPLADEHLELEVELDSDPEVMTFIDPRAGTREEVEVAHRRRLASAGEVDGLGYWIGFAGEEFVGWWLLRPPHGPDQPPEPGAAELGYRLLRRQWRRGYASEGSRVLLRHGFETVGLHRIFAQAFAANGASLSTMRSIGMSFVRAFPSSETGPVPGLEQGEVEYDISRDAWFSGGRRPSTSR